MSLRLLADAAAQLAQRAEHAARRGPADVVLDGFERSIQLDAYSCGAQATFSILTYFGKARSLTATMKKLGTDESGTHWAPIERLLRARGLGVRRINGAGKKDLERAVRAGRPVLVLVDDGEHWASVYGVGRKRIYVADPSPRRSARVVVDWSHFRTRWDGWAAVVSRLGSSSVR